MKRETIAVALLLCMLCTERTYFGARPLPRISSTPKVHIMENPPWPPGSPLILSMNKSGTLFPQGSTFYPFTDRELELIAKSAVTGRTITLVVDEECRSLSVDEMRQLLFHVRDVVDGNLPQGVRINLLLYGG